MIVNDCADHGVLATHLQKLATRQVALKVQAQKKSVANAHLAPSSRSWRFKVVSPQLLSRVDAHWQEKRQKDSTPDKQNANSTSGRTLAHQRTRCQVGKPLHSALGSRFAQCTRFFAPGESGWYTHRAKNAATLGAFTRFACHTCRNQAQGGGWGVVSEKNDCEHNGPGQQQQPAQKKTMNIVQHAEVTLRVTAWWPRCLQHDRSAGSQAADARSRVLNYAGPVARM